MDGVFQGAEGHKAAHIAGLDRPAKGRSHGVAHGQVRVVEPVGTGVAAVSAYVKGVFVVVDPEGSELDITEEIPLGSRGRQRKGRYQGGGRNQRKQFPHNSFLLKNNG